MKFYKTNKNKIVGSSYKEKNQKAQRAYREISSKTKRRPYIRSAYFNRSKIFLGLFWPHLYEKKTFGDRERRVEFFVCAIDLLKNSKLNPESREDSNVKSKILHRFYGISKEGEKFCVQIKEDKRSGEKFLISIFPYEEK